MTTMNGNRRGGGEGGGSSSGGRRGENSSSVSTPSLNPAATEFARASTQTNGCSTDHQDQNGGGPPHPMVIPTGPSNPGRGSHHGRGSHLSHTHHRSATSSTRHRPTSSITQPRPTNQPMNPPRGAQHAQVYPHQQPMIPVMYYPSYITSQYGTYPAFYPVVPAPGSGSGPPPVPIVMVGPPAPPPGFQHVQHQSSVPRQSNPPSTTSQIGDPSPPRGQRQEGSRRSYAASLATNSAGSNSRTVSTSSHSSSHPRSPQPPSTTQPSPQPEVRESRAEVFRRDFDTARGFEDDITYFPNQTPQRRR